MSPRDVTFRCLRDECGRTWPQDPARLVACPTCHASVGSPCMRPSEHRVFAGEVHPARDRLAAERGLYGDCPLGRCKNGPGCFDTPAAPSTELTPIGEQYVVPGCERRETARGQAPTQLTLWDAK